MPLVFKLKRVNHTLCGWGTGGPLILLYMRSPPLKRGDTERYLGIQIGHDLAKIDQWSSTTTKLQNILQYWNRFNLSVFGRNLLINSNMLSQIWFKGAVLPATVKQVKGLDAPVNNFFRKGKRNNSVLHATRVLPSKYGGLGQIHITTQLYPLRIKWMIRYEAGKTPLWAIYWAENVRIIKEVLGTETDLRVYNCNWSRVKATALNGIFPFVLEAYKSWHTQDFKLSSDSFDIISSQPLIDNKYILEENSGLSLKATDDMQSLIKHMYTLNVGHFFEEVTPEPTAPFQHSDPDTWKYSPRDGDVMNDWAGLNFPVEVWFGLFDLIPANIIAIMVQGI